MKNILNTISKKINGLEFNDIKERASELSNKAKNALDDVESIKAKGKDVGNKISALSNKARKTIDDVDIDPLIARGKNISEILSNVGGSAQTKLGQMKDRREEKKREKAKIIRRKEEAIRIKEEEKKSYEKLSMIGKASLMVKRLIATIILLVLIYIFSVIFIAINEMSSNEIIEETTRQPEAKESYSEVVRPGVYYVSVDVLEERLSPSASGSVTNRIYYGQKLEVYEVKNSWARVSRYYDGWLEGKVGQVARWVNTNGLSSNRP